MADKLLRRSIIIPARNESKRIGPTLEKYGQYFLTHYPHDSEIVVAANACTDNTEEVVASYEKQFSNIRHISFPERGKGLGITKGLENSKGKLIGFTDADGSTPPEMLDKLFLEVEQGNADCAIGSRWIKGSVVKKQPLSRQITSRTFNLIVNLYFQLGIRDTQCGAKVASQEIIKKILPELIITDMAIDINYLYSIKKAGGKIVEIPITWNDVEGSTVSWKVPIVMFMSVSRLRLLDSPFAFIYPLLHPFANGIRKLMS